MLVTQLVHLAGLTVEKALAIVERYPTPKLLLSAIKTRGTERGEGERRGKKKKKRGRTRWWTRWWTRWTRWTR